MILDDWQLHGPISIEKHLKKFYRARSTTEKTFTSFYIRDVPEEEAWFAKSPVFDISRWAKR